jgi:hypothetical protein
MSDAATIIAIWRDWRSGSLTLGHIASILRGKYIEKLSLF